MSEWISVEDRLPEGDCLVIVEAMERISLSMHTAGYHSNINIIGGRFEFDMPPVTHWMPLPEPPQ